jgi:hypothetical protein
VTVAADIEAAKRALDPAEREAKLKQALAKAKNAAHTERNLRGMAEAERDDLRREVESLRSANTRMATAIENATPPDFSAKEVRDAKAVADRAVQSKMLSQVARDEARARADAAEKARAEAEAESRHVEKHADRRVREAEKVRDEVLEKAAKAGSSGFQRGVDAMERAYVAAVLAVKKGVPGIVVLNDDAPKEEMYEQVWGKAYDIVKSFRDQIDLDDE